MGPDLEKKNVVFFKVAEQEAKGPSHQKDVLV